MTKKRSEYGLGKHPKSVEALKKHQYKKGESGHPAGRPQNVKYVSEALREQLKNSKDVDEIARNMIKRAKRNDYSANLVMERTEGRVTQPLSGLIKTDVTFIIGKGYADSKPDIHTDK